MLHQGLSPSKADEQRMKKELGDKATYDQTQKWLMSCTHPEDDVQFLAKLFQQYDKENTGKLRKTQIVHILTHLGEDLTMEETNKILS